MNPADPPETGEQSADAPALEPEVSPAATTAVNHPGEGVVSPVEVGSLDEAIEGEAEPPIFVLNVKCIDGTTTKLEVPGDLSGADLKELICVQLGVPANRQRLIFRGHVVKDGDTVDMHLTEDGLTMHMVQRPVTQEGGASGSASGQPSAAGQPAGGQPQMQFQFATGDPMGLQQIELSQILGTMLGAVGRGQGVNTVIHTAPMRVTTAQGGGGAANASASGAGLWGAPGHGNRGVGSTSRRNRATGRIDAADRGHPQAAPADGVGAPVGLSPVGDATVFTPPLPPGTLPAATDAPGLGDPTAQQPGMALHPLQIIFQQGLGNLAQVIPGFGGEGLQSAEVVYGPQPGVEGPDGPNLGQGGGHGIRPGHGSGGRSSGEVLPWRDLRRLNQHLARVLGRPSHSRQLPPADMPAGELAAFLASLHSATSQLGVAVGDFQASLADGSGGPQPRHQLQFAMALVAAARTLRGMATALQSGLIEGGSAVSRSAVPAGTATAAAAAIVGEMQRQQAAVSPDAATTASASVETARPSPPAPSLAGGVASAAATRGASSDSEDPHLSDAALPGAVSAVAASQAPEAAEVPPAEALLPAAVPVPARSRRQPPCDDGTGGEVPGSGTSLSECSSEGPGERAVQVEQPTQGILDTFAVAASESHAASSDVAAQEMNASVNQAQAFLSSPLTLGPPLAATANVVAQHQEPDLPPATDEERPTAPSPAPEPSLPDFLESMPPEVSACWQSWTRPEVFGRVIQQAVQPPLSESYVEGDATGSHRAPQLPPPMEFLPLRWQRTAGRVDGIGDVPESPEQLSRAYLCAFLRDLGRHTAADATFRSVPNADQRYPNLSRLSSLFGHRPENSPDSHGPENSPDLPSC